MKTVETKTDYVAPNAIVIRLQNVGAILSGSVPGGEGVPVDDDDYDY